MEFLKNKKNLYIVLGVATLLIIFIASYFLFFRPSGPSQNQKNTNLPFGTGGNGSSFPNNNVGNIQQPSPAPSNPPSGVALWKISEIPVTGATIVGAGTSTSVYFVEKATGHVYKYDPVSGAKERISNTTLPKTSNIVWGKNADSILFQYEDGGVIKTYFAQIATSSLSKISDGNLGGQGTSTSSSEHGLINGKLIEDNISKVTVSPTGERIFYLTPGNNTAIFYIANFNGDKSSPVYYSHINGWQLSWPKEDSLTITSSPSGEASGFSYIMSLKNKSLQKVVGSKFGLTALFSSSTKNVLFSQADNLGVSSSIYYLDSRTSLSTSFGTFSEKCAWGKKNAAFIYCGVPQIIPRAIYPDDWYQGKLSFSDNIWVYDTNSGGTETIAEPSEISGEEIDLIDPSISSDETLFIFRNKKDYSLWGLKLDPNRKVEYVD